MSQVGWPVVVGAVVDLTPLAGAAVVSVAAVGAVEPHFEQRSVVGEEFTKLIAVVGEVLGASVVGVVAIPRRQIDAEPQPELPARGRQFLDDIALAIAPGAVLHGVRGVAAWPEAEAVVVLGRDDEAFHSGVARHASPLADVERRWGKDRFGLVAKTPLAVRERVHPEVQEAVEAEVVPCRLTRRRHRRQRFGRGCGSRRQHGDGRNGIKHRSIALLYTVPPW